MAELISVLKTRLAPERRTELCKILEPDLEELVRRGAEAWPEVSNQPAEFIDYVARRLVADRSLEEALAELRVEDLYLACACARGDTRGLAAFDEHVLKRIDGALRSAGADDAALQDAKQELRERLLVGAGERGARVADYSGRGSLQSWVRITALRILHNQRRKHHREVQEIESDMLEVLLPAKEPELAHLKLHYRQAFKEAFAQALPQLDVRDRVLLRQHLLDELPSHKIAALHRVHRATVSRWLVAAQEQLVALTRSRLGAALDLDADELDSIMRLIRSRMDASVYRLLEKHGDAPDEA